MIRPHGISGELRVYAFEPGAPNLQQGKRLAVGGVMRRIRAIRPDRSEWLVTLEGVTTREQADELKGALFELPDDQVRRNDSESYFLHELIGLDVVTSTGEDLGKVAEVLQPGANDVYVVRGPLGEVLIPAIGDVVDQIDIAAGRIVITPLPGLLDTSK